MRAGAKTISRTPAPPGQRLARTLGRWLLAVAVPCGLALLAGGWRVRAAARGRVYSDPARLPADAPETGVVLGNNWRLPDGRENPHFAARLAAAARWFRAGRGRALIVSGNNDGRGYDEPAAMRAALLALGVPAAAIRLDPAGFRTLDTVVRAREVFGLTRAVFITDRFHADRTLFLADHGGPAGSVAFVGEEVPWAESFRSRLRECLADVRACLDVDVLGTRPRDADGGGSR